MKTENLKTQPWDGNRGDQCRALTEPLVLPQKWSWKKAIALITALIFTWSMCVTPVMAETINLEGGSIDVNVQDNTTNWNVTGNPVWNVPTFNVAENSIYNIAGLGTGASLALLVNGGSASNIFGTMNLSNLDFILQNIAGINIGASAMINLSNASLIASTLPLNLNMTDFLNKQYEFSGQGGLLTNDGKIIGSNADLVALVANALENKGTIDVPAGTIALASGNTVTVGISPDGMVSIGVDEATANTLGLSDQIKNSGTIQANGGKISLNAKAMDGLFDKAINISADDNATAIVVAQDGTIEFVATGDILNAGTLDAIRGTIEIDTTGDFESTGTVQAKGGTIAADTGGDLRSSGYFETDTIIQTGAAAYFSGTSIIHKGSRFTNLDDAVNVAGDLAGIYQDTSGDPNINFTAAVNLIGDTTLQADADATGSGTIIMNGFGLTGNNFDLTLYTGEATTLDGDISGVDLLTLNSSTTTDRTYTSTGTTFSVNTLKTNYHSLFSRDSGAGTALDPKMIYSVSNLPGGLQYIGTNATTLDYEYQMANNIDASETVSWNAGAGFAPIGNTYATRFTGSLDGQEYTIAGFTVNRASTDYVGLFGYTEGFTIQNVGLVGGSVRGRYSVGGLVGRNYRNTTVDNCYVTGNVFGVSIVGGLVGQNEQNSAISNSYATGAVSGSGTSIGGLVGSNSTSATIINSYATGAVSSAGYNTGGLVGGNSASIDNSYATGSVSGRYQIGGLVGNLTGGSIDDSYATGNVLGSNDNIGGLVGYANNSEISNSYASGTVAGDKYVGGLVGYNFSNSVIANSFATGVSNATAGTPGGLIGLYSTGTLTNNWWYNGTNSQGIGNTSNSGVTKAAATSDFYGTGSGTGGAVYRQGY